ncbi:MAG: hypothetical protein NTY07_00980 [Bacteroidia bacterium]|nr:hypothetical protein [Bacteroidia bacterium]
MKTTLTILISVILLNFSCKESKDNRLFKTTYFNLEGEVYKTVIDTITLIDTLDITFYSKHFYKPYYYPKKFIDKRYKDETLVVWLDSTKEKKFYSNWTITYKYDSLSRVIEYGYSGCFICSQLAYKYIISYDNKNRPIRMTDRPTLIKTDNESKSKTFSREFVFLYDDKENIIQIQEYVFGKLTEQIEKI